MFNASINISSLASRPLSRAKKFHCRIVLLFSTIGVTILRKSMYDNKYASMLVLHLMVTRRRRCVTVMVNLFMVIWQNDYKRNVVKNLLIPMTFLVKL